MARLREQRVAGTLTAVQVRAAAAGVGVAERTVWAWLAQEADALERRPRTRYVITDADRDAYADNSGNIAAVYRVARRAARVAVAAPVAGGLRP